MWKFVRHHEFYLGSLIFLFSVIWMTFFIGSYNWFIVLPLGISWIGLICIFDFFERKYFRHTIIPDTHIRKRKLFIITIVSLLFCVLLDGFGVFINQLWYYPFWSLKVYLFLAPFAYVAYSILLYILYEFARDFIVRFEKINFTTKPRKILYETIINMELILGVVGYFLIILNLNQKENISLNGFYMLASVFICTFFIFEFIGFKQNKQTLTYDITRGNWWPILFITLANITAIILIEFVNAPFQVWHFANWPYDDIRFFNVPIMAILIWPLQFPVFLSMLRALFPSKEVVW